ncbi:MAG: sensor histidine kinase, partial [Ktedonobacterales bacterium]
AHDLKTPLTCIQGHAQLLSRYVRTARAKTMAQRGPLVRLLEDCERHLPALEKQVTRIEQLLRDTLDLARSDDGDLALTLVRANLSDLLARAARAVEAENSRGIAIDAPTEVEVRCDAARIERVLGELISYVMRSGGSERGVRVRVTETGEGDARFVRIAIEYTQPAQPSNFRSRSTSIKSGTNSAASPLDLRLAVGAAILRQHGGSLRHLPDKAGGSELLLVLPALETPPSQQGEIHGAPDRNRGR